MSNRTVYTDAFREQALQKVYSRGDASITSIAEHLNISHWTLKNWMKSHQPKHAKGAAARAHPHTAAKRLQLLLDSHALDDVALGAFCRQHGLFAPQLLQWREAFETDLTPTPAAREEVRELKHSNAKLERELRRKEKALAEAAALLVLQRNSQSLWEDKGA